MELRGSSALFRAIRERGDARECLEPRASGRLNFVIFSITARSGAGTARGGDGEPLRHLRIDGNKFDLRDKHAICVHFGGEIKSLWKTFPMKC